MAARVGVFAGVLVRRRIATERDVTGLAGPKVNPSRTDFNALEALETLRLLTASIAIRCGHGSFFTREKIDGR